MGEAVPATRAAVGAATGYAAGAVEEAGADTGETVAVDGAGMPATGLREPLVRFGHVD